MKNVTKSEGLAEVKLAYRTTVNPETCPKIQSSQNAADLIRSVFSEDDIERIEIFALLLLSRSNRVLGWAKISQGGVSATVVDAKVVFQTALLANASSIILTHNHPSGNTTPSEQDKMITKRIKEGGKLLEIEVLDHIIITKESYYSFADEGII